jgi:hypothetical protein
MGLFDQMRAKYRGSLEASVKKCKAKKKLSYCVDCKDYSFCRIKQYEPLEIV